MASSTAQPAVVHDSNRSGAQPRASYSRREPEKTVLYQVVSAHLEPFLRYTRESYKRPLPRACPRCHARLEPIAVIRRQEVIDRILRHLALPLTPTQLGHADTVAFDVTGELMPNWVEGVDPEPEPDARAPPNDWDGLDPPAPDA